MVGTKKQSRNEIMQLIMSINSIQLQKSQSPSSSNIRGSQEKVLSGKSQFKQDPTEKTNSG
jgi:hypothetical protein